MSNSTNENLKRIRGVFDKHDWNTRADILSTHDKDADWTAIRDIGEEFAPLMRQLMALSDEGWYDATGLLPYEGYVPARPSKFKWPVEGDEEEGEEVLTDDDKDEGSAL